jgi:hypothetical protein
VNSHALSKTSGLLSDPSFIFDATQPDGTDTATFAGTANPDSANPGRYNLKLALTIAADPVSFTTVLYQSAGGQLLWIDEDENDNGVFLGFFEQQGSLTGLPAAQHAVAKAKPGRKQ